MIHSKNLLLNNPYLIYVWFCGDKNGIWLNRFCKIGSTKSELKVKWFVFEHLCKSEPNYKFMCKNQF